MLINIYIRSFIHIRPVLDVPPDVLAIDLGPCKVYVYICHSAVLRKANLTELPLPVVM